MDCRPHTGKKITKAREIKRQAPARSVPLVTVFDVTLGNPALIDTFQIVILILDPFCSLQHSRTLLSERNVEQRLTSFLGMLAAENVARMWCYRSYGACIASPSDANQVKKRATCHKRAAIQREAPGQRSE